MRHIKIMALKREVKRKMWELMITAQEDEEQLQMQIAERTSLNLVDRSNCSNKFLELSLPGAKVPYHGTFAPGSENS